MAMSLWPASKAMDIAVLSSYQKHKDTHIKEFDNDVRRKICCLKSYRLLTLSLRVASQPGWASSRRTISTWPCSLAHMSAVEPSSSWILTFDPVARRIFTMSMRPWLTASMRAVWPAYNMRTIVYKYIQDTYLHYTETDTKPEWLWHWRLPSWRVPLPRSCPPWFPQQPKQPTWWECIQPYSADLHYILLYIQTHTPACINNKETIQY